MSRFWFSVFLLVAVLMTSVRLHGQTPSNDNFANRLTLSGSAPIAVSNNLLATRETGEPNHAGAAAGRSLWYTWTAPATGTINVSAYSARAGSPLMCSIAIYTGDSFQTLSEVASSNDQAQSYYNTGYYYLYPPFFTGPAGGTSVNVPVTAGSVYQIAVDSLPVYGYADDGTVVLAVNAPPTIVSAATATGATGASFSYTAQATAGATAYAATDLPTGLALNAVSGQITGTPAATGTYSVGLSATGPGGTGTGTLTIRVTDPGPVTPTLPVFWNDVSCRGYVGVPFSFLIYASGSPTSYAATNLPDGLSLNTYTGAISGAPTATGTFAVPISATGAGGTGTATLTILIDAPPLPFITSTLAASGTTGVAFYYSIDTNLDGSRALLPNSYTATNLPPGLWITMDTGTVSGTPTQAGVYTVPISAANAAGVRRAVVTVTIRDPVVTTTAAAPVLGSQAWTSGIVGADFSYTLFAANSPTSYTAANLPPGITFNSALGKFGGAPTAAGVYLVPVTATNSYGTSTGTLTINVAADAAAQTAAFGNPQPILTSAASAAGYVGQSLSYGITALLPGLDSTSYYSAYWNFSATGLPPGLSVSISSSSNGTGSITGTPTQAGVYQATISTQVLATTYSSDGSSLYSTANGKAIVTFIIAAGPAPVSAPVITGAASATANLGASLTYSLNATNSPTSYAASNLPPGLSLNTANGLVTGTPTTAGTYVATLSATNATGTGTASVTFTVTPGFAPLITSAATASGTVGQSFGYSFYANASPTGYGAGNLPPGLSFDSASGYLSGTPTQAGVFSVPISATNANGTANATLTVTIAAATVTRPPAIISKAVASATVGQSFYYSIYSDVSTSSFGGGANLPPGLSFLTSGTISGTPTQAGTYRVPLSATNAAGTGAATLTIVVAPQTPPVFTSACALAGMVGQSFYSSVIASNNPTGYTFSGLPPGVSQVSASSGQLSGLPTQAGTYNVPVTAANAAGTTSVTLTITISPAQGATPVFTSAMSAAAYVNQPFSYFLQASNSPTSYNLNSLPAGVTFNSATATISGKPTSAGSYAVSLSAANATGTGQATLNLTVLAAATAPPGITSAAGITVPARQVFYHRITTDSPATSYGASGLPAGVSLDAATGLISGKPTVAGTYQVSLTATGSAGQSQATLAITVRDSSAVVFTQPATFATITGQAFSGALTTSAANNYTAAASNLPTGFSINSSTGVISGSSSTASTKVVSTTMSTDYGTASGKLSFLVRTVAPVVPVITSPAGVSTFGGMPFSYPLQATNSPTSFAASGLPPGVTLDPDTGWITGGSDYSGSYEATVTATNSKGTSVDTAIRFYTSSESVPARVSSAAGASGVVGSPFSYALTTNGQYINVSSYSNLPPGLGVNTSTGLVTGTPTASGTYRTVFYVSNSYGSGGSGTVTFNILATGNSVPMLTGAAGAAGTVGNAFSYTVAANNGPTSYTAANLPPGLSFNKTTRVLSGTPTAAGTYAVSLTAANAVGTGGGTLTLVVAPATLPALTSSSNLLERAYQIGDAGLTIPTWILYATGTPTSYAASGLPPGLSLDPDTGYITGTLTTTGVYPVTVSAANGSGTVSAVITCVVTRATPTPPLISSLSASLVAFTGLPITTVSLVGTNSPTSYTAEGLPPGLSFDPAKGQVSGTPTAPGTYAVNFSTSNASGAGTAVWTVVVNDASVLYPVFSSLPAETSGVVGASIYRDFYAYVYYGGQSVSAASSTTVSGLPPGVQCQQSGDNGLRLTGTPTTAGTYPLTVTATVPGGGTATANCTLVVFPASGPTITSPAVALGNLGKPFAYFLYAGGDNTSYSAGTLPAGLSFNASSGTISGTPTATGTFTVPVSATGNYGTVSATITLRVEGPLYGGLPVITSAATLSSQEAANNSTSYSSYGTGTAITYTAATLNGPVTWTATNVPAGMAFNPYNGTFSGQPTATGAFLVPISASNAAGTVNATLTVISNSLLAIPHAPLASSSVVGAPYSYSIAADYPALGTVSSSYYGLPSTSTRGPVTFSAVGLPPGLTINSYSGLLSGTPTRAGTYPVKLTTANRAGNSSAVLTLSFASPDSGTPATPTLPAFYGRAQAGGFLGLPLSYSLSASGSPTYAATGLPSGLTLNASTGVLSGTPASAGSWPVVVSATNAAGTAQATLTLTADPAPTAPTLTSDCAVAAKIGVVFGYTLSCTNYDYEPSPTAYAASGLPTGLSLNTSTGYISGTPAGPVGTYSVPVTVSVGPVTKATGVVTVIVQPAPAPTTPLLSSSAGALALVGNPFYYAAVNKTFAPTSALPPGLTYDAAKGIFSGYPTAPGVYVVSLAAGGTGNRDNASAPGRAGRDTGRGVPVVTPDDGGDATAALTIRVLTPQISLPRLTAQPVGGNAMDGTAFTFSASAVGVPTPDFQWKRNGAPLAGATGPSLTFGSLQTTDSGVYSLMVGNAAGSVTSASAPLVVQTVYSRWQAGHFSASEIAAGLADDLYSFSGDGVPNLIKYALGLDPRANAAGSALPVVSRSAADGMLAISFVRDASRSDINYLVEFSVNLSAWTKIAESDAGAAFGNTGAAAVAETGVPGTTQYQTTVKATPSPDRAQFLRVRIVRP